MASNWSASRLQEAGALLAAQRALTAGCREGVCKGARAMEGRPLAAAADSLLVPLEGRLCAHCT